MPLELKETGADLSGNVSIEEAELLYQWLLEHRQQPVVLQQVGHFHTAIWQLLLLFRPELQVQSQVDDVIKRWLLPELLPKE